MKVALYCRVSTEEQDLDKQEYALREYCDRQGLEVYAVYKDVYSGAQESRPAFNRLLEDLRAYKFSCVLVTKLDRIGRSLSHLLSLFDEFSKKGVHFIALTQNIDTTSPQGRLMFQILGAFAEFEREIIRERTREGLKRAQGVGKRGKDLKPRKKRGGQKKPWIYTGA